jgi:hypothetical protein
MRDVRAGEQAALRCGLTLIVPQGYRGWYAQDPSGEMGTYDTVGSKDIDRKGLVASFMASSDTEEQPYGPYRWPLVTRSADGVVEVRCFAARLGTAKACVYMSVVVRQPGRPVGLVELSAYGEGATDEPDRVMAQVASIWRDFSISGVDLPTASDL